MKTLREKLIQKHWSLARRIRLACYSLGWWVLALYFVPTIQGGNNTSNPFFTPYLATVTIGSTTYANAVTTMLPKTTAAVVKKKHYGGITIIPDGLEDLGSIRVTLPNDGPTTAGLAGTSPTALVVTYPVDTATSFAGHTYTAAAGETYCTLVDDGDSERGRTVDRTFEFTLLAVGTWT